MPPPGPYYPPGPALGVSPYHSPRPSGSPAASPYTLPPMVYPGQPGIPPPPPVPVSGYGTPPYPMYPPYPYGYGQPYMYWPPPGAPVPPGVSATSPLVNPAQSSDVGIPPPTMLARPPPPSESEAIAGYREVGIALPPPAKPMQDQQRANETTERGRRTRELSFGTAVAGDAHSPHASPGAPGSGAALELDVEGAKPSAVTESGEEEGDTELEDTEKVDGRGFTVFSIGVAPGEAAPARIRSRTRTQSRGAAVSVVLLAETSVEDAVGSRPGAVAGDDVTALADVAAKVIDLTDPETKWEFGTTKQSEQPSAPESEDAAPPPPIDVPAEGMPIPHPLPVPGAPFVPLSTAFPGIPPYVPPVVTPGGPAEGSAPSPSAYGRPPPPITNEVDEWKVRDYGWGFGRGGPQPTYPPPNDRPFRDGRDLQPQGEREHYNRPRRGSYGQGGYDRGSYSGRRGRGLSGGYGGRGYSHRSFSGGRGGYSNQGQQRQQGYVPPQPPPPPQPQPDVNGYYAPPIPPLATYIPSPYDAYPYAAFPPPPPPPQMAGAPGSVPAPLPVPQSQLLFPLDSTRYYLLGQLEYYLSAQNMAQDFFLRQQMDSRGWIPIPLIASFNRVRTLTTDAQLVTDVLTLSSLVEVRDGYVRMRQWQQFVFPNARKSIVEPDGDLQPVQGSAAGAEQGGVPHAEPEDHSHAVHQHHDGEEDEEEDVVFVL
ncbi:hypothetical protein BD413DRAFT_609667 [Trametes elegans]|nr:hypothetical protein BD413DRAFT_609667 [Trametes elegans]